MSTTLILTGLFGYLIGFLIGHTTARKNILENIALSSDMPAKLLNNETFAEGFGEGTEDAKVVAQYIDRIRTKMQPLYDFFDRIVMYRAWNPDFYKTMKKAWRNAWLGLPPDAPEPSKEEASALIDAMFDEEKRRWDARHQETSDEEAGVFCHQ